MLACCSQECAGKRAHAFMARSGWGTISKVDVDAVQRGLNLLSSNHGLMAAEGKSRPEGMRSERCPMRLWSC